MFSNLYIYSIKQKHWWSLTLSCPTRFRERFRPSIGFKNKVNATNDFYGFIKVDMMFYLLYKVFNFNSSFSQL